VRQLLAFLAAPADVTESPVSEAEFRALLRDSRAVAVDAAALLKKATPPTPSGPRANHTKPASYVDVFLKPSNLQNAQQFMWAHSTELKAAQDRHAVLPADIVAVLLWQSNLGSVTGDNQLFTLFLGQAIYLRDAYAQAVAAGHHDTATRSHQQLLEKTVSKALETVATLVRSCKAKGIDVLDVKGVEGGGAGYAQFTPTGFRWMEDGDGDGRIQLENFADAIMSIANCLDQSGYRKDRKQGLLGYNPGNDWAAGVMRVGDAIELSASSHQ
jgi:membrane-bound lytic murein transglycosylase B